MPRTERPVVGARRNGAASWPPLTPSALAAGHWPGVSVLVPVRGDGELLAGAIRSVLAQDYAGPVEVVVADGAPGGCGPVVVEHPAVRTVANPAGSTPAGLNAALRAAAYPVVARCDVWSVLPPGYLCRAVATLVRTGAANVGGRQCPTGATFFGRGVGLAMTHRIGAGGARYRIGGAAGPVDTVYLGVFRREALEACGGFDEGLPRNQDYELNWRLRSRGETVWFDPDLSVGYRPRGSVAALARQYFDYGRWKRAMLRANPRALRPRQLAAPSLVLALAASAAAALAGALVGAPALLTAALPVPAAYAATVCGAALTRLRGGRLAAVAMPLALAVMHLAWGIGFLAGPGRPRDGPGRAGARPARYKRPFDVLLATLGGVVAAPLWIVVLLAIRLVDGRPVLFRQVRLGRDGRPFGMLKFRTMLPGAEAGTGPVLASSADPRTTRLGRVLRRYHLDEIPQLVNVLRGDMSLVGPRPERPELAARFQRAVPGFADRLAVRPGIAGLAQAHAGYGADPRRKLRYDRLYIRSMGPAVDLRILAVCIARTLRRRPR